ncbi:MAG: hypothetical protein WAO98_00220 [Alphaproteobacteria bacterium]
MLNKPPIPFSKEPIFVDWRRPDVGGLRIAAWTDASGNPYIGVFTLNREGKPNGIPCWYERQRFMSYVVIGFDSNEKPVKVFLDAEVTHRGVQASLQLPWEPTNEFFYHRRLFARWDS